MKKSLLFFVSSFLAASTLFGQTKIKDGSVSGSSVLPNGAAILDLESSNKGLLLPRVSLSNTTAWGLSGTAVAGMSVYNENSAIASSNVSYPIIPGGVGQYYFDGTGWVGTKPSGGAFWSLTGNAGTDPLTNFLGTTDAKPLRFKVDNVYSGYVGLNSYPGGGSQDLNTAFGYGAGGDVVNRMTTTGAFRKMTAIGYMALGGATLVSGQNLTENTGVGFEAGRNLQGTSHRNTLIGSGAGSGVIQGTLNTVVGQAAMFGASGGDGNVFVGQGIVGAVTTSISNNTYIGTRSGLNSTGNGNIHLGYNAGYNSTASNRLIIDNSDTNTPLIDGDLANKILTVNQTLKVAQNAAIGTVSAPQRTLHVVPAAGAATSLRIEGVPEYADNPSAIGAGLQTGDVYRTGDVLKIVH